MPTILVRCLTIEFEIELGLGSTVVPVGKKSELAPPQAPLCERGASNGDAHARPKRKRKARENANLVVINSPGFYKLSDESQIPN
jgi:hypothetical protein